MRLMPSRISHLEHCYNGLQLTGIPFIEYVNGTIIPALTTDDLGIYFFIPKFAQLLHISIHTAINIFFLGMLVISYLMSLYGMFKLFPGILERIISGAWLTLFCIFVYSIGDTYIAYYSAVCLIPCAMIYINTHNFIKKLLYISIAGILLGFFHCIRSASSLAVLLFIISYIVMHTGTSLYKKILLLFLLLLGATISPWYVYYSYQTTKLWAQHHIPNQQVGQPHHVFWHPIYLGFSFLNFKNPTGIQWGDDYAAQVVAHKNPNVTLAQTDAYEAILKEEVINLIKNNTLFVIFTLFAKLGILALYFLIFANIGIFAAFYYPKPWYLEGAFFIAFVAAAVFPLLVLPLTEYTLSFISLAAFYGLISFNYALAFLQVANGFYSFFLKIKNRLSYI